MSSVQCPGRLLMHDIWWLVRPGYACANAYLLIPVSGRFSSGLFYPSFSTSFFLSLFQLTFSKLWVSGLSVSFYGPCDFKPKICLFCFSSIFFLGSPLNCHLPAAVWSMRGLYTYRYVPPGSSCWERETQVYPAIDLVRLASSVV